uniref:Uncharacterized protein n=1 Tax=Pseudomonas phage HRDY3 TaxID=3236930 RepID=A0AB39CDM3_9VIRU
METIKKYGKMILGGLMFVLALAAVVFARRPKPEPEADTYKGDRLEEQVQTAPIIEQQKQVEEILKPPVEKTVSKDMNSAINAWKTAGD